MHLQSLEEMHLQENALFDLLLTWGEGHTKRSSVHSTSSDLSTCIVCRCCVQQFGRRCIYKKIHYMTFELGVIVLQNITQYPLHHVTYAATKFEVATSNGLTGGTFT